MEGVAGVFSLRPTESVEVKEAIVRGVELRRMPETAYGATTACNWKVHYWIHK